MRSPGVCERRDPERSPALTVLRVRGRLGNHSHTPSQDPVIRRDMLALVRQAFEGRYEVEREIGKGGNARIFLARSRGASRSRSRSCTPSSWSASPPTGSSARSSWPPSSTIPISPICSTPANGTGWSTTS